MKKSISDRLNMYGSVLSTLNSHQPAWNNVPAFAEAVTQFTQKLAEFRSTAVNEANMLNGVKADRDASLNEMKGLLIKLVRVFRIIGSENGINVLKDRYRFSPSRIMEISFGKLDILCATVDEDLQTYAGYLGNFGILQIELERYAFLRAQLHEFSVTLRNSVIGHSVLLNELDEKNHELTGVLNKLDALVRNMKHEQPGFHTAYFMSRHTIEHPNGSRPPTGSDQAA